MAVSDRNGNVGVVGDLPEEAARSLAESGARLVEGSTADVLAADPDWLVAVGETALLDLVRAGVEIPVLPVAAGPGVGSVSRPDAAGAVETVRDGEARRAGRRLLSVAVDDETAAALFDVTVLTAEPAKISEYTIHAGDRHVASLRADGLVVATPAGSHGYAGDVGGPVVEPGTGVVAVVPIAPFATDADHWILAPELRIEPEREGPISVIVDDRERWEIAPGETVRLEVGGHLPLLRVPASRGAGAAPSGLEKL